MRIHDKDNDPSHMIEWRGLAEQVQRLESFDDVEYAAQGNIVGDATVNQVKVRSVDAIVIGREFLKALRRSRGGARHGRRIRKPLDPAWQLVVARSTVVVNGHGRQNHRNG